MEIVVDSLSLDLYGAVIILRARLVQAVVTICAVVSAQVSVIICNLDLRWKVTGLLITGRIAPACIQDRLVGLLQLRRVSSAGNSAPSDLRRCESDRD